MSFITELWALILTVCILLFCYALYVNNYWKRNNVPYIKGVPFLGNISNLVLLKKSTSELMFDLYNNKDAVKNPFVGIHVFQTPVLLIRDPELVKRFLIKDFEYFSNRHVTISERVDSLGAQILFLLKNPTWRKLRIKTTPMFTGGKMKSTFPLIAEIGEKLDARLTSLTKSNPISYEVHDLASLYTGDVIASVAFNIHANSIGNPSNPFKINTDKVFEFSYIRSLSWAAAMFVPRFSEFMRTKFFPDQTANFLRTAIKDVLADREKTNIRRNDVIDNLVHLKNSTKNQIDEHGLKYDGDLLYAQAAVYYTAGYGTTATTMGFSLLELSKRIECQERLRKEIHDVLLEFDGKICYDAVMKMPYLEMVIFEALRMYPTLPFLERQCTLPKGQTHCSLEPYSDFKIPNGMPVYVPAYALHRDPKYYPDPDDFKPERFSPENKDKIPAYTFMPFGIGPRNCIGGRLGLLMVKIGLVHFFLNHRLQENEKTPQVVKLQKRAMIIQAEGGLYCDIIHDPLFK